MGLFDRIMNFLCKEVSFKFLFITLIIFILGLVVFNAKSLAVNDITDNDINIAFNSVLEYHTDILSYSEPSYYIIDTYSSGTTKMVIITLLKSTNAYAWVDGTREIYYISGGNFCQYSCTGAGGFSNVAVAYNNWNNSSNASPSRFTTTYNNFNIYYYSGGQSLYKAKTDFVAPFVSPYLENTSSDLENWTFSNLLINSGSVSPYFEDGNSYTRRTLNLEITNHDTGIAYTIDLWPYLVNHDNEYFTASVPRYVLTRFNVRNGLLVDFDLFVQPDDFPTSTGNWSSYPLSSVTLTISSSDSDIINQDTQTEQLDNINTGINNLNTNINDLNTDIVNLNTDLMNSSIDSSNNTLFSNLSGGFVATDNSGIESLFTLLYNAFCLNEPVSVSFVLPFVNKPVTISSSNISSFYPSTLKDIVSVIIWGVVGLFILKDVRSMVNKINEGRITELSHDVKKEVL